MMYHSSFGTVKHLSPAINEFFKTKIAKCAPDQVPLVRELARELYGQSFDTFTGGGWTPGRHPITASSSTKCLLQSWFRHNQFPQEPLHPRVGATFRMGNIVELDLYLVAILAGEEVSDYQHQAQIQMGGWPTNNYLDFIHTSRVDGLRRVVDCKTMSSFSYQRVFDWGKGVDDSFGYLGQMSQYVNYALEAGLADTDEGVFLCYKKDTGHIDEHIVRLDKALIAKANASSKIIQDHTEYTDCSDCVQSEPVEGHGAAQEGYRRCHRCMGVPLVAAGQADSRRPPRPAEYAAVSGPDGWRLPLQCSYCDYKFSCWTRPWQRIGFSEGKPVYEETPEQYIQVHVDKKGKPQFLIQQ